MRIKDRQELECTSLGISEDDYNKLIYYSKLYADCGLYGFYDYASSLIASEALRKISESVKKK